MRPSFIRSKKISWKLTLIYAFIFSMMLILLNAVSLYGVRLFLNQQSINQVNASSKATEQMIIEATREGTGLNDSELLSEAQSDSEIVINIAGEKGNIINSSDDGIVKKINILALPDTTRKIEINERHYVVRNSIVKTAEGATVYLQIIRSMEKEYNFIKLLFVFMAITDCMGIIISVFVGYLLSKRTLRPIERITNTAKSISVSDLNSRIAVGDSDDELARLAVTFNEMIERLKLSFDKQNQFVSDASHELRTPIAVIQSYINLVDRWGKDNKDVLQESIQAIKNETSNMTDMIERLLFLARSDSNQLKLKKDKLIINELIDELIRESKLISPEHNIIYKNSAIFEITADRRMIKQLLRALVDNSIKYTPTSGKIEITTASKDNCIEIEVTDTGIGIPKDELENIFGRFYRVDKTRTKDTGGSGLGLSIVKQIVESHNGTINVKSTVGEGTRVTVLLPTL